MPSVRKFCFGFKDVKELNFTKGGGLIPAIIQHVQTGQVLMLGFMNEEALEKTLETGLATFYSRDRQKLWTKGEESGHFLHVRSMCTDCDQDTLLLLCLPEGPTCHKGTVSCFDASPFADATARYLLQHKQTKEV